VGGVGFVHTTTIRLPSRTKRLFSKAGFGLKALSNCFTYGFRVGAENHTLFSFLQYSTLYYLSLWPQWEQ
jgi:hypothetical protein